jgi:Protein of unknown function (DUF2845)
MNLKLHPVLCAVLAAAMPLATPAGSLECQGNIISPGITEAELLQACGEPTSRDGTEWIYRMQGDFPMVVTFGNDGVVTFIRDATDLDSPASPLGDSP